ncbi:MAG: hypothetical protein AAGH15_10685 [Myxococcota bacterium]
MTRSACPLNAFRSSCWALLLSLAGCAEASVAESAVAVCQRAAACGELAPGGLGACVRAETEARAHVARQSDDPVCLASLDGLLACVALQPCGAGPCEGCRGALEVLDASRRSGRCSFRSTDSLCGAAGDDLGLRDDGGLDAGPGGDGDAGPGGGGDSGTQDLGVVPEDVDCPSGPGVPNPEGLRGPCCSRRSNAERRDAVTLRLNGFTFRSPASLAPPPIGATPLVNALLQQWVDEERFNLLVEVAGDSRTVTVTLGGGIRERASMGDAFRFASGDAPVDEASRALLRDAGRWDPVFAAGVYEGDQLDLEPAESMVVWPAFLPSGARTLELPLRAARLRGLSLDPTRTCAGRRDPSLEPSGFAAGGTFEAFIHVDDVLGMRVVNPPLSRPLCGLLAQTVDLDEDCDPADRSSWTVLPEARCVGNACWVGRCDPATTCNAWHLEAAASAAGVAIE